MKTKLKYFIPLLFLLACNKNKDTETTPVSLYPQPQTARLNTNDGYTKNTITGETILPLILKNGDTILTGAPIPFHGKIIHPDSVSNPTIFPAIAPTTIINAHPNVHKIRDSLTKTLVNQDFLVTIKLGEGFQNRQLVNEEGDSIPTGKSIPTQGNIVSAIQPVPTEALPPRFKDAAINNIQYLDVDQGMISSYLASILEDKSGNLWFGTFGGGVSMYNGESFTHFTDKEGLSNNTVRAIFEDKSGNLWFGTDGGGVSMYNGESFNHLTSKEGLSNNKVRAILEDKKGNLWFGTWGGGISKYNGKSFTYFTVNEGLSNNHITSILEDKSGNLWFGTWGGGVSMYNGESFTHFTHKDGLSNNTVTSILEDKNENLWFGCYGSGVSMYNGESFTHFSEKEGLSHNKVRSICEDKSGNLWFGTHGGGASMYNGETFTHFTDNEGLSNNTVLSIIEDKGGNLWFATFGGGVSKYNRESFTHFTDKEGLSNNTVRSILEDKNGNLWFGTDGGGVSRYNGDSFTHFTNIEGLRNNIVLSIIEDKSGNLWFGTWGGGVSMYNGESFTHFTNKEGLGSNRIYSILEDKSGNLWFGTNGGGVCMYNGEFFTHFTDKEGLSSNSVYTILEDKSGNLWFGTDGGGVSRYNGKSITHFTDKEGLSNNIVWSIHEDKSGNLWFGTWGGGVSMFNGESFTHFTDKEGLSNNYVWSILEDNSGNIWLSTERGLNRIKQNNITQTNDKGNNFLFDIYGKNDGLKGLDFYSNSVCLDSKNRLWWGSGKSLTMLDMNKFNAAEKPPVISLQQLDINQQFIDYRNVTDSLNESVFSSVPAFKNYPLNLELPYHKNHLTFHFAAVDWHAPHKIKYSYLIEGLNTVWSPPSHESKADYRNIPYGTYSFKVRAIGASDEWSDAFEYEFTIHPPWWHTWWARTAYGITALFLIFGYVRWRTAKLKERQKELEAEVEIATQDLIVKNQEISKQKEKVEQAHKEITDSINYAERIQRSFLATTDLLDENLSDYFVFFQPKDVVSGDFYWAGKLNNGNFAIVNADSTGHGVPGAIMSILNISSIEEAVKEGSTSPNEIFNKTRKFIIDRLKKDGSLDGGRDGMDASIICFNFEKNKFTYTAAQNPIWIIRDGMLIEIKPEKMPIGKHSRDDIPFKGGEFEIQKGDQVYTLTDGYQDQFGGPKGKKFMAKKMREHLLSISHLPMTEQHQKIKETFNNWKGDLEQIDDICVIGVRI